MEWLNLTLGRKNIEQEKNDSEMQFFEVIFEKYLGFNKQIKHIKSKFGNRTNILKHLIHKSWRL